MPALVYLSTALTRSSLVVAIALHIYLIKQKKLFSKRYLLAAFETKLKVKNDSLKQLFRSNTTSYLKVDEPVDQLFLLRFQPPRRRGQIGCGDNKVEVDLSACVAHARDGVADAAVQRSGLEPIL
jgi:hypothetical protein